jgi:putative ABC transport system permease protein
MLASRWKKVLADLWGNKVRTLLVAMSIAVGIFAVGVVASSYFILKQDVPADYLSANPHSAIIFSQYFDDDLLVSLARTPGIAQVEGRSSVSAQIGGLGDKVYAMQITSIPQINDMKIDTLRLEKGIDRLGDKEIYLERSAIGALGVSLGDSVRITLPDGRERMLKVVGIVDDVTGNPFLFSQQVSGFVTPRTLEWMGGSVEYSTLLLTVSEHGNDEAHVREVAGLVSEKVKKSGREVFVTVVYHPGEHPIQQILDALLALMGGMGMLAVLLSGFLVINTLSALMGQQIRQIGVMKAVGATMGQITAMYMTLVLGFGIVALVLSMPLASLVSYGLCNWIAGLTNIDLAGFRIPTESLVLQVAVGLGVPMVGAFLPVMNGARLTVREAISNYGLSSGGGRSLLDRLLETVRGLPRPLLISLRNTFRRKARLTLTLSTLTLAGAIFMGVFNVRDSMYMALDKTFGYFLSDVNVDFSRFYRKERVAEALKGIPGIVEVEGWGFSTAQVMRSDGKTGEEVIVFAPPAGSHMIEPVLTSGRWLLPGDENGVVFCNHFIKQRPEVQVGDVVQIRIENRDYPFQVVGICEMAGNVIPPFSYVNYEYLAKLRNEVGQVYSLRIVTDYSDPARQTVVAQAVQARLEELGMDATIQTGGEVIGQQRYTVDIMIYLLLFMAMLIAFVGGLGLMGTMSMNVLERTREIGVMRSIGAVDSAVFQLVVVEGILIGLMSWGLGALVAVPITNMLDTIVGVSLLNVPLKFVLSQEGMMIWFGIVLVLSALASILPARNAVRLTVRDVLAYE